MTMINPNIFFSDSKNKDAISFWDENLKDISGDNGWKSFVSSSGESNFSSNSEFSLSTDVNNRILKIAPDQLSRHAIFVVAVGILLNKYFGNSVYVFNSPPLKKQNDLEQQNAQELIPLILNFDEEQKISSLLLSSIQKIQKSYTYQNFPFKAFIEDNFEFNAAQLSNIIIKNDDILFETGQNSFCDLIFDLNTRSGFELTILYNPEVIEDFIVKNLILHLSSVFAAFLSPKNDLKSIDVFSKEEKDFFSSLLQSKNDADTYSSFLDVFREKVKAYPAQTAIICNEKTITYSELDELSANLAHYLIREYSVKKGDIISVILERSERSIIALLGVMKAGAVYLPIDPNYPAGRVDQILKDSASNAIITDSNLLFNFPDFEGALIALDIQLSTIEAEIPGNDFPSVKPDDIAYIIYTSGSTGTPKGCKIAHQSLYNYLNWAADHYIKNHNIQRFVFFSSPSFDFSLTSMLLPFICGKTLMVFDENRSVEKLLEECFNAENKIDILKLTPSHIRILKPLNIKNSTVKSIIVGGEALLPEQISTIRNIDNEINLYNEYGPTEATVGCIVKNVKNEQDTLIGKPIDNCHVYILNKNFSPAPIGVFGEIYLGGNVLSKGYISELATREKFFKVPPSHNEIVYSTGDLGRILPDGNIEYSGRIDEQVKINGYRVEIAEVQAQMLLFPLIQNAVVICEITEGINALVAFYKSDKEISAGELYSFLIQRLPAFMVPSKFIYVDEIPLTRHGKINKNELFKKVSEYSNINRIVDTAIDENEAKLQGILGKILGNNINVDDNFWAYGLDSLKAIKAAIEINSVFNKNIEVADIFSHITIRTLMLFINNKKEELKSDLFIELGNAHIKELKDSIFKNKEDYQMLPDNYQDLYPLVPIENGMIYSSILNPLAPVFYDQYKFELEIIDFNLFKEAIKFLVQRHDNLRSKYYLNTFKEPLKVVVNDSEIPFEVKDVSTYVEDEKIKCIASYIKEDLNQRYSFEGEFLWHMKAFKTGDKDFLIVWSFHHALLDGWSTAVFKTELSILLSQKNKLNTTALPPLKSSYKDYAAISIAKGNSTVITDFWNEKLNNYVRNKLPFNYSGRMNGLLTEMKKVEKHLSDQLLKKLEAVSFNRKISFKAICLSAHIQLMSVICSEEDVVTGVVTNDRALMEDSDKILGCFLNTIPVRINVSEFENYNELINSVNNYLVNVKPYEIHLTEISKAISEKASLRNPIFDTLFNYTDMHVMHSSEESENFSSTQSKFRENTDILQEHEMTNTLFDLEVDKTLNVFSIRIKYTPAYFKHSDIVAALDLYIKILEQIAENDEKTLAPHHLLTEKEKQKIVYTFNDTIQPFSSEHTIQKLFEEQVAKTPENIAIRFKNSSWTYLELNERSNQIARLLINNGVCIGDNVAIIVERGFELIAGIYGVLKAGAVYIPIEPDFPEHRKSSIIESSQCQFILTSDATMLKNAFSQCTVIDLFDYAQNNETNNLEISVSSQSIAYIIHTSGSTGVPKGVIISHKAVANLLQWVNKQFNVNEKDNLLCITSICFDLSVYDVFGILSCGATIVMATKEDVQNTNQLKELLQKEQITFWNSVPTTLQHFVNELIFDKSDFVSDYMRLIFLSGDWIPVGLPGKVAGIFPNGECISLGGATEGTVWSNYYNIKEVKEEWESIPYGYPIDNSFFYILDKNLQPLPYGVVGELYIGGVGVALGYNNNIQKSNESFILNPFHSLFGGQMYKTGDLGLLTSEGYMKFIGRKDNQVKVRGYRIELGDIEAIINKHKSIKECVVVVNKDKQNNNYLVAYLVKHPDAYSLQFDDLKKHLGSYLPSYMVPNHFFELNALPLNYNGKVDRKLLPAFDPVQSDNYLTDFELPNNEVEKAIAEIFKNLLNYEVISRNDNIFELGAHSLIIGSFINRVKKLMNVSIGIREVFTNPVIKDLAELISNKNADIVSLDSIQPIPLQEYYDVSHSQKRFWILEQFGEDSASFNNMFNAYLMEGTLDINVFEKTISTIVERHESLRTTIMQVNGELKQKISTPEQANIKLEFYDYRHIYSEDDVDKFKALINTEARRSFNIEIGPLVKFKLFQIKDNVFCFLFSIHHIISDGWSLEVFQYEISNLYNAYSKGKDNPLPHLKTQFKDYVAWQNNQLKDENTKKHKQYWLDQFSGEIPKINLPYDNLRKMNQSFIGSSVSKKLNEDLCEKIVDFSKKNNVSLFMTLLSGLNTLLYKYTGKEDIIVGTPIAGRDNAEMEYQIGLYLNTLALRTRFSEEETFIDLLANVKNVMLQGYEHQSYPFDKVVDDLKIKRNLSTSPLFNIMVVLHNAEIDGSRDFELNELRIAKYNDFDFAKNDSDFTIHFNEGNGVIYMVVEYNTDIYNAPRIERLISHFEQLMASALNNPNQSLLEIDYLPSIEKKELLALNENGTIDSDKEETVTEIFNKIVHSKKDKVAISFDNSKITYGELGARSDQLASHIINKIKVEEDTFIGVMMERSINMIVSILGILKAGAAYVPIDPAYPESRIKHIIKDANLKLLITEAEFVLDMDYYDGPVFAIDVEFEESEKANHLDGTLTEKSEAINIPLSNRSLKSNTYVIYTSGSTGNPKGVIIQDFNIVNLLRGTKRMFNYTEQDVWTFFHSISFDYSVWEIFGCLLSGGRLEIIHQDMTRNPKTFVDKLIEDRVTILSVIPSMFYHIINEMKTRDWPDIGLRYVMLGGESLQPHSLKEWQEHYAAVKLINMYGLTETTVISSVKEIGIEDIKRGHSNIGTALPEEYILILDNYLNLVPKGIEGEIFIGGLGLAKCYANSPELTKDRFLKNPFSESDLIYRTGDLGIRLDNGDIIYAGRKDDQVKISGYRIELGEIEHHLISHPYIKEALVIKITNPQGEDKLAGYYSSLEENELSTIEVKKHLRDSLPEHMVPAYIIAIKEFPKTANGKVDKKALSDLVTTHAPNSSEYVSPENEVEKKLVEIWMEILLVQKVSVNDNFFDIGGNSLKIIELFHKLAIFIPNTVSVPDLFTYPTVRELSIYIYEKQGDLKEELSVGVEV